MFGLSPFDMMMYEQPSSSYYMPTSRAAYVPSTYGQRYVYPSHRYVVPKEQPPQHIDVEDLVEDDDEVAECVARVIAAQQKLLQAELELQRQQEQLAHAKKAAHLRASERERKEREEQQAAYYQAILAERHRRQQLYEQQMKLREEQMRSEFEKKQLRQLEQENQARARTEDEVKREFLTQLLGEMFGQQLVLRNQPIKPQQPASKQSAKPVVKPVAKSASAPVKSEPKVNQPSAKEQSALGKVEQSASVKNETSFSIPARVINSAEPSDKAKSSSSVTSRVSVPLTVNTSGPSSPVEIEDEPITPEQWNLDASDVFKADRVHTPVPSEPSSPKQTPTDATNSTPAA